VGLPGPFAVFKSDRSEKQFRSRVCETQAVMRPFQPTDEAAVTLLKLHDFKNVLKAPIACFDGPR